MTIQTKKTFQLIAFFALAAAAAGVFRTTLVAADSSGGEQEKSLWTTNYSEALAKAKAEDKIVMLEFHGSDWCPPCIKLNDDILSTSQFKQFAKKNLVMVNLDFPRKKSLPEEQKAHNQKLASEYSVQYFPTVVLVSPDGKELDRVVGYPKGGMEGFLSFIQKHTES